VGCDVRIVFLTVDEPLYLPSFFRRILARWAGETSAVYVVPPLYRNQNRTQAAVRYYRTFGATATVRLAERVMSAKLTRRSIEAECKRAGVPCEAARDVNAAEFLSTLKELAPDVIVSVSCPQIFKPELIAIPKKACLNVHGALLPNYRGMMPSFWMLANGETEAGVSVHEIVEQIDAGDLYGQARFAILPDDSLDSFLKRSKEVAADLLTDVLEHLEAGTLRQEKLDLSAGSYYSWPDRDAVDRFAAAGRRLW
jgi:methionyl-tRNA formyltransferase